MAMGTARAGGGQPVAALVVPRVHSSSSISSISISSGAYKNTINISQPPAYCMVRRAEESAWPGQARDGA
jgi:hypothetical protein